MNGIELDVSRPVIRRTRRSCCATASRRAPYCWRHQLEPLATAATTCSRRTSAATPGPSRPRDVTAYGIDDLSGDLLGLLDVTGHDDAVFVGHDWGALLVWDLARLHRPRARPSSTSACRTPRGRHRRRAVQGRLRRQLLLHPVLPGGRAGGAELETDVDRTMRTVLWAASGDGVPGRPAAEPPPAEGSGLLDVLGARHAAGRGAGVAVPGRRRDVRRRVRGERVLRARQLVPQPRPQPRAGQGPARRRRCRCGSSAARATA